MSQRIIYESVKLGDLERRINILEYEVRQLKELLEIHEKILQEIQGLLGGIDE